MRAAIEHLVQWLLIAIVAVTLIGAAITCSRALAAETEEYPIFCKGEGARGCMYNLAREADDGTNDFDIQHFECRESGICVRVSSGGEAGGFSDTDMDVE